MRRAILLSEGRKIMKVLVAQNIGIDVTEYINRKRAAGPHGREI